MLQSFAESIVDGPLNLWVQSSAWLWPTMETIHFIGLSLLLGSLIVIDLRMAGHFRSLDPSAIHKLLPWTLIGFGMNLTTGILFFYGDPLRYAVNIGFQVKMVLVVIAGINALLFYWKVTPIMQSLHPDATSPPLARVIAYTSLATWFGVLLCGRLIPYVGTG